VRGAVIIREQEDSFVVVQLSQRFKFLVAYQQRIKQLSLSLPVFKCPLKIFNLFLEVLDHLGVAHVEFLYHCNVVKV
jgi:hypothetical protein